MYCMKLENEEITLVVGRDPTLTLEWFFLRAVTLPRRVVYSREKTLKSRHLNTNGIITTEEYHDEAFIDYFLIYV